jgi:cAMP-dependent protein kinase regulator
LEEGIAVATKTLKPGQPPQTVMTYQPGGWFGELALLKNVPRQANIIAQTDLVVASLDRGSFKRLLGPLEDILKRNQTVYEKFSAQQ